MCSIKVGVGLKATRQFNATERHVDVLSQLCQQITRPVLLHRYRVNRFSASDSSSTVRHIRFEAVGNKRVELHPPFRRVRDLRDRARLVGPLRKLRSRSLVGVLGEDVVEKGTFELRHEGSNSGFGKFAAASSDVVQAGRATGQKRLRLSIHRETRAWHRCQVHLLNARCSTLRITLRTNSMVCSHSRIAAALSLSTNQS